MQHTDQATGASEVMVGTPTKQQSLEVQDTAKNSNDDGAVHGQPSLQSNTSPGTSAKLSTPLSINRADLDAARPSPTGTPIPYDSDNLEPKDDNDDSTAAPSTKATHGRKPSLTEKALATVATAATSAASAASTVVSAAMKLAAPEEKDVFETAEAASTGAGGASTGILPVSMRSTQNNHQGLEFSQRKMSVDRSKIAPTGLSSSANRKNDVGEMDTSAVVDSSLSEPEKNTSELKISGVETVPTGIGATAAVLPASATLTSKGSSTTPVTTTTTDALVETNADLGLTSQDKDVSMEKTGTHATTTSGNSDDKEGGNADGNKDEALSSNKPASAALPLKTMYVAGHAPESARHQGMNVDHPAVSHTSASKTNLSGMGVDKPKVVGEPRDPNSHRTGSLHVDKHPAAHPHGHYEIHVPHHDHSASAAEGEHHGAPIQTSKDNSKVIHGNEHHLNQNTSAEAKAAIAKNPFETHMSHHRGSVSSGMGVDHPVIPTANLAGSGSSDNTNRNRPHGTYNSAINVDKAGSPDHKRSGMNVDGPAAAVHHLATVKDPLSKSTKSKVGIENDKRPNLKANNTTDNARTEEDGVSASTSTSSKHYPDDDRESVLDKFKNAFRRRSSINTMGSKESSSTDNKNRSTGALESGILGTASSHPTMKTSSSSPEREVLAPAEYNGPVPETAPGEEVVWVKRVVQTDYYEDDEDRPRALVEDNRSRRPHRSLLDRLRGRHPAPSVDKGKQRVQDF